MVGDLENMVVSLHESLVILSLDAGLGLYNGKEIFNQKISKNYEILGVLYKEILLSIKRFFSLVGSVCQLKLAHIREY